MKIKKIYIKDLSVEEVIARLKRGEVMENINGSRRRFVDGVLVGEHPTGEWGILPSIHCSEVSWFQEEIFIDFKIGNYYKTTTGKKALCYHIDENAKENEPMFFFAPIGTENRSVIMLNEEGDPIGNEVGIECELVEEEMSCEKSSQRDKVIPISRLRDLLANYKKSGLTWRVLYEKCGISTGNFYHLLNSRGRKYIRLFTYNKIEKAIEELTNVKNCD